MSDLINQLPEDVIYEIINQLSKDDMIKLCSTNRYFRQLCNNSNFWNSRIRARFNFDLPNSTYDDYFYLLTFESIPRVDNHPNKDQLNLLIDQLISIEHQGMISDNKFVAVVNNSEDYPTLDGYIFEAYTPAGIILKVYSLIGVDAFIIKRPGYKKRLTKDVENLLAYSNLALVKSNQVTTIDSTRPNLNDSYLEWMLPTSEIKCINRLFNYEAQSKDPIKYYRLTFNPSGQIIFVRAKSPKTAYITMADYMYRHQEIYGHLNAELYRLFGFGNCDLTNYFNHGYDIIEVDNLNLL